MFEPTASGAPRSSSTIRTGSAQAPDPAHRAAVRRRRRRMLRRGQQYPPENEVHLLDRLAVLYRYRRLCVTVFVLVTAAMIIQGYSTVQGLSGAGAPPDRRRALDGGARAAERAESVLRGSRAVLPDAVQDPQGPRPDPPRRAEAAPRERPGVQRHQAGAADADVDAERSEDRSPRLRAPHAGPGRRDRRRPTSRRTSRRWSARSSAASTSRRSAAATWST